MRLISWTPRRILFLRHSFRSAGYLPQLHEIRNEKCYYSPCNWTSCDLVCFLLSSILALICWMLLDELLEISESDSQNVYKLRGPATVVRAPQSSLSFYLRPRSSSFASSLFDPQTFWWLCLSHHWLDLSFFEYRRFCPIRVKLKALLASTFRLVVMDLRLLWASLRVCSNASTFFFCSSIWFLLY